MRFAAVILIGFLSFSMSAQKWEKLDQKFRKHYDAQEYPVAGKFAEKEIHYSLKRLDSTDIRYMRSYHNMAKVYFSMDEPDSARTYVGIAYRLMVPFYDYGADLGEVYELSGRIELQLGHHERAASFHTYARDVNAEVFGAGSREYLQSLYYIAELEMARSQWQEMAAVLEEALAIHQQHFPKDHDYVRYANYLGLICLNNGVNDQAEAHFRSAISAYDETGIEKDLPFGHANNNLALACYYQSDFENASIHFQRADSIYRILVTGYSENYMMLLNNLASLYYSWDKPDLAGIAYRELEQYLEKYPDGSDLNYIQGVENLAHYYAEAGDPGKAEKYYQKAIGLRRSLIPADQE
jgi:tetratricopeptide (TPR) repeat protein